MAVLISDSSNSNYNQKISTTNGFYTVVADNLSASSTTILLLSVPRFQSITPSANGNCVGVATWMYCNGYANLSLQAYPVISFQEGVDFLPTAVNTSTERITITSHGLSAGDIVFFTSTGTLPGGLSATTVYYVINPTTNDFQVSTSSGGSAVNLTSQGTGTHTLWISKRHKIFNNVLDIFGTYNGNASTYVRAGTYIVSATWTGYSITTTGKYRLGFWQQGLSYNWYVHTSDGTNITYAVWTDTQATFTNGDILLVKDKVIIDKSVILGGKLGIGDTANGISGWVFGNVNAMEKENVALLEWENPPSSSYTLTIRGKLLFAYGSGFRIGTESNPIPYSKQAKIIFDHTNKVGTNTPSFSSRTANSSYEYSGRMSILFYGEYPNYISTTLTQDVNTGSNTLYVADEVDWQTGDIIVIGKRYIRGATTYTTHTITGISGTTITISPALDGYKALSGASVVNLSRRGIYIENNGAISDDNQHQTIYNPANFDIIGAYIINTSFSLSGTTYYYFLRDLSSSAKSKYRYMYNSSSVNSTSAVSNDFYILVVPENGIDYKYNITFRRCMIYAPYSYRTPFFTSGVLNVENNISIHMTGRSNFISGSVLDINFSNNKMENGYTGALGSAFYICGFNSIFKNNYCYGFGNSSYDYYGTVGTATGAYCLANNNIIENCRTAFCFGSATGRNIKIINNQTIDCDNLFCTYGGVGGEVYIINHSTGTYTNLFNTSYFSDSVEGVKIAFQNINNENKDITYFRSCSIEKTGLSMTDTTVKASDYGIKLNPLTTGSNWFFDVPVGNIQSKTMTVAVWVKLGTNYTSGTYTLPKLTVTYDLTSTVEKEAINTTDWQLLAVSFEPQTTTSSITISISGYSSTGSFYIDEFSILYPAGYVLNLGNLDNWYYGLPTLPPISTSISAKDVWTALTTENFGSNTMGERVAKKLLDIKNFIALS